MSVFAALPGGLDGGLESIRGTLAELLETGRVRAVLVMLPTRDGLGVQPALVTNAERLQHADPLLPVMPIHMARMASLVSQGSITEEKPAEGKIGVVGRPCELRGMVELAKLNQLRMEDFMTIGIDCAGTFEGSAWRRWSGSDPLARQRLEESQRAASPDAPQESYRHSCSVCDTPVAWDADLAVHWIGVEDGLVLEARDASWLPASARPAEDQPARVASLGALETARRTARVQALDAMEARMHSGPGGSPGLMLDFEACQRCHNCTVACPICYCKECLFRTDAFRHEPRRYFGWAERKGAARLPGDTLTFQLTRLCHVTTSCVGCGMCTSACPAELPVDLLFQTVARRTQALFDYVPGRSLQDPLPPATFERKEFVDLGEAHR
jgi:formate dehydrogenase subunit beta